MLPDPGKKINDIHKTIINVSFRKLCLPYSAFIAERMSACTHTS